MDKKRKTILIVLMILILLIGVLVMAYPAFSSYYAETVRSQVLTEYQGIVNGEDEQELAKILAAAQEYNDKLFRGEYIRTEWEANGYYDQIVLNETDIMGYIRIPKIDVQLPIYHGTQELEALSRGCGHMEQSSLPVGGTNTHAVLSAHTGMAESAMFTDLEQLETGDVFYIDILGQTLAYQVMRPEDITVVLPHETDNIRIERGQDLVTLVTCTPYGVNTHRLLVKGTRIPYLEEEEQKVYEEVDLSNDTSSVWAEQYLSSLTLGLMFAAVFVVFAILLILLQRDRQKKKAKAARKAAQKRKASEKEAGADG